MKTVRILFGIVVEIIPDYALPVEKWYNAEFAAQCVEAPDNVGQRWKYDAKTGVFSKPEAELTEPKTEPSVWDELDAAYTVGYNEGYQEGVNTAYDNQ